MRVVALLVLLLSPAAALILSKKDNGCEKEDLKHRAMFQNKLAGACVEMCKEIGAYPDCQCPKYVKDSSPGVMTWDELNTHMDNLVNWGKSTIKGWQKQANGLIQNQAKPHTKSLVKVDNDQNSCSAQDLKIRQQLQNKLANSCMDMCKEIGAYPKCECPGYKEDTSPGVMTWEELLAHMDNLVDWGGDMIKTAKGRAAKLVQRNVTTVTGHEDKTKSSGSVDVDAARRAQQGVNRTTMTAANHSSKFGNCKGTATFKDAQGGFSSVGVSGLGHLETGCKDFVVESKMQYTKVELCGEDGGVWEIFPKSGCPQPGAMQFGHTNGGCVEVNAPKETINSIAYTC